MINLDFRKKMVDSWFSYLQIQICKEFKIIDNSKKKFIKRDWYKKIRKEGGGTSFLLSNGNIFEKVGVNISTVSGEFSDDYRGQVKGTEQSANYWASGISLVAHMQSPKVPAFHFNTRFLVTDDFWFGGGADMTPTFENQKDTDTFHKKMKESCDSTDEKYYKEFKKNCDEYFYLPHREEARGVGGIFFDHLNTNDWDKDFNFIKEVK